ncbi:MAG TPA: serine/threonine protein kinase, partial [Sorangium sp.]|nr:serine/threonine protein kinase [Sorangium sp.]
GRGGMAAVYQALNIDIGKRVAIKLLAGHLAASRTVVQRFLREARAVSRISSPHICDIYDSGRLDDGTPFLVMELLEGESLYDAMCRDRQMSPKLTLAIILQVGRGLAKAHDAGIVHRDLKPENIFLTVDVDGQLLVKVLDFGLAKFYDNIDAGGGKARLTREGAVFGTPAYMSPEQVRGQAAADTRADLWALACITYECFTGTTVWSTDEGVAMTFAQIATAAIPDPREYRPDLPLSFNAWFNRALARDINVRFQTVGELADALVLAFDYQSSGGGLDAKLVNQITQEASGKKVSTVSRRGQAAPATPRQRNVERDSEEAVSVHRDDKSLTPPPRKRSRGWIWLAALVVAGGAATAAVVATPETLPPPAEAKRIGERVASLAHAQTAPTASSGFAVVAKHPWLPRVREAQVLVARGDFAGAKRILTLLQKDNQHPLLKNMKEQVAIAALAKSNSAHCQVAGYARPRRTDLLSQGTHTSDASTPYIVRGNDGALMVWTDSPDRQRRASAVLL